MSFGVYDERFEKGAKKDQIRVGPYHYKYILMEGPGA